MSMKSCPSCGTDVPKAAARCKECFHDFLEEAPPKPNPMLTMLGGLAVMAIVGALTFNYISSQPTDQKILVDQETESIIFTTPYRTGIETDRLNWSEIGKLEHHTSARGDFEIVAVELSGTRTTIQTDPDQTLLQTATIYSKMMGKPLEVIDNTPAGFGKKMTKE
jgi:hypothetical protein